MQHPASPRASATQILTVSAFLWCAEHPLEDNHGYEQPPADTGAVPASGEHAASNPDQGSLPLPKPHTEQEEAGHAVQRDDAVLGDHVAAHGGAEDQHVPVSASNGALGQEHRVDPDMQGADPHPHPQDATVDGHAEAPKLPPIHDDGAHVDDPHVQDVHALPEHHHDMEPVRLPEEEIHHAEGLHGADVAPVRPIVAEEAARLPSMHAAEDNLLRPQEVHALPDHHLDEHALPHDHEMVARRLPEEVHHAEGLPAADLPAVGADEVEEAPKLPGLHAEEDHADHLHPEEEPTLPRIHEDMVAPRLPEEELHHADSLPAAGLTSADRGAVVDAPKLPIVQAHGNHADTLHPVEEHELSQDHHDMPAPRLPDQELHHAEGLPAAGLADASHSGVEEAPQLPAMHAGEDHADHLRPDQEHGLPRDHDLAALRLPHEEVHHAEGLPAAGLADASHSGVEEAPQLPAMHAGEDHADHLRPDQDHGLPHEHDPTSALTKITAFRMSMTLRLPHEEVHHAEGLPAAGLADASHSGVEEAPQLPAMHAGEDHADHLRPDQEDGLPRDHDMAALRLPHEEVHHAEGLPAAGLADASHSGVEEAPQLPAMHAGEDHADHLRPDQEDGLPRDHDMAALRLPHEEVHHAEGLPAAGLADASHGGVEEAPQLPAMHASEDHVDNMRPDQEHGLPHEHDLAALRLPHEEVHHAEGLPAAGLADASHGGVEEAPQLPAMHGGEDHVDNMRPDQEHGLPRDHDMAALRLPHEEVHHAEGLPAGGHSQAEEAPQLPAMHADENHADGLHTQQDHALPQHPLDEHSLSEHHNVAVAPRLPEEDVHHAEGMHDAAQGEVKDAAKLPDMHADENLRPKEMSGAEGMPEGMATDRQHTEEEAPKLPGIHSDGDHAGDLHPQGVSSLPRDHHDLTAPRLPEEEHHAEGLPASGLAAAGRGDAQEAPKLPDIHADDHHAGNLKTQEQHSLPQAHGSAEHAIPEDRHMDHHLEVPEEKAHLAEATLDHGHADAHAAALGHHGNHERSAAPWKAARRMGPGQGQADDSPVAQQPLGSTAHQAERTFHSAKLSQGGDVLPPLPR